MLPKLNTFNISLVITDVSDMLGNGSYIMTRFCDDHRFQGCNADQVNQKRVTLCFCICLCVFVSVCVFLSVCVSICLFFNVFEFLLL